MWQQQDFLRFADETCRRAKRLLAAGRISPEIATEWQHRATEALRLVSQNLQKPRMKIAIKRQPQAKLNLLTSLKEQVRTASTSVLAMNGPRAETNRHVQWDDVKSAFRTLICTGIVSNLRHTMIHEFLEDAAPFVTRKIQDALGNAIKVNTLLTCNYIQVGEEDPLTNPGENRRRRGTPFTRFKERLHTLSKRLITL